MDSIAKAMAERQDKPHKAMNLRILALPSYAGLKLDLSWQKLFKMA